MFEGMLLNMKIEAIISDMDGTLVQYENSDYKSSWDAIGNRLTGWRKDQWFLNLEIYYKEKERLTEWSESNALLLKGLEFEKIKNALLPVPYSEGVEDFFKNPSRLEITGILSGGISIVADEIKNELDMHFALSCNLGTENGHFNGEVEVLDMWKKHEVLEEVLKKNYNISMENVCYIGDHDNDIDVFRRVGISIAFDPKTQKTIDNSDYTIYNFKDIREILGLYSF